MKNIYAPGLTLVAALLCGYSASAMDVTVLQPLDNASVGSSFNLKAQSLSCLGQPVVTMAYSIGNGFTSVPVKGTNLDAQVSASPGSNQILHVKSWGQSGAGCVADVPINVTADDVLVATPANGATVSSPFQLQAHSASCGGQAVVTMAYSIDNSENTPAVQGTSLTTQITAQNGADQILHVKSWGARGAGCVTDVTVNVANSGFDGSSTIPNPPPNADHVDKIQMLSSWSAATGAASQCPDGVPSPTCNPVNANFNPTVGHGGDPVPLANSNGLTGEFQLFQGPPYATALWGHPLLTQPAARNFIWDFYLYMTTSNYQAVELDFYDSLNQGQHFMVGTQCNQYSNTWDTWNEATAEWLHNPSMPCDSLLSPGTWHHLTFYATIDSATNSYTYHVLRIDGVDHAIEQTHLAKQRNWPDGLIGVQVQLDANHSGAGASAIVENMQLFAWNP